MLVQGQGQEKQRENFNLQCMEPTRAYIFGQFLTIFADKYATMMRSLILYNRQKICISFQMLLIIPRHRE